jgi:DNA transposition AAA+ family ATPase
METHDTNDHPRTDLTTALQQDAFFREVRMPTEQAVSETSTAIHAKQIRLWLAEHSKQISQTKLAEKIGISATQLSQILGNKYPGDAGPAIRKIYEYMDTVGRRQRVDKGSGFVDTTAAKRIFAIIKETQTYSEEEARIAVIVGDSGHGKSVCLKQYAKVNLNSLYVELDDTMSAAAMFSAIAKGLGMDSEGGLKTLTQRIIDRLGGRELTMILDEASGLNIHKLNLLRQIICVRCKCPLILAGNAHLLSTMQQDSTRRGNEALDQFRSRMLSTLNLDELAASGGNGGGGLYTEDDIKRLYEYGGISLTKDARSALRKICKTGLTGRLRTCSIIITMLHKVKVVKEEEIITGEYILDAITQLGLPIKDRLPFRLGAEDEEQKAEVRSQKTA